MTTATWRKMPTNLCMPVAIDWPDPPIRWWITTELVWRWKQAQGAATVVFGMPQPFEIKMEVDAKKYQLGKTRVFLKWKPVPTVDKVVHRVDLAAGRCHLDNDEVAALGALADVKHRGQLAAGVVAEFAVQPDTGLLVGQRLRSDKKHGNAPETERDVRNSAALGLTDVGTLAAWLLPTTG